MHGRYSIIRKIAEGGMAEIFLAELEGRQGFKKLVVLKCIRTALYADPSFRQMLVDEALISTRLNHGNIVQVLDLGEAQGRYFLALELVDGWSLDQLFKRAQAARLELKPELALFIIAETCRALAFAHSLSRGGKALGIVHRDISPQNVLISEHGDVKLADFGIAKALTHEDSGKTAAGVVKGKLAFMSPEQAKAAPIDARSDLFSLGTVLYLLSTGVLPFQAPTAIETLARVQSANFTAPEKARPGLHKDVARIISKAMKLKPEDRYQSADEMMTDLERVMRQLRPVGQTELSRWLSELSSKDGERPISRHESTEEELDPSLSGPVELSSSNIELPVPPPLPKTTPSRTVAPVGDLSSTALSPRSGELRGDGIAPREDGVRGSSALQPKKKRGSNWLVLPLLTLLLGGGYVVYQELQPGRRAWKDVPAFSPTAPGASARSELPLGGEPTFAPTDVADAGALPEFAYDMGQPMPPEAGPDGGVPAVTVVEAGDGGAAMVLGPPAPDANTPAADAGPGASEPGQPPGAEKPDDIPNDEEEARLMATAPEHPETIVLAEKESVSPPPVAPAATSAAEPARAAEKTSPPAPSSSDKKPPTATAAPVPAPAPEKSTPSKGATAAPAKPSTPASSKSNGSNASRGGGSRQFDSQMLSDPSETVSVFVQSQPPGAIVRLHDRVFGRTPIPLRFKPGMSFELTFLKSGYQRTSKKFFVSERNGQKVTAYLKKGAKK